MHSQVEADPITKGRLRGLVGLVRLAIWSAQTEWDNCLAPVLYSFDSQI